MSTRGNTAIAKENGLPEGWEWSTLGDVSEKPQYGWTTKANHKTGKLKLLRTTDITSGSVDWPSVPFCSEEPEDVEKYLVESGDILISRAGSVGVSFLINKPERAVFASYLIRFRPRSTIDTKYFYYYLKSPAYWEAIGASKSGIAVPNVNASKLANVSIPVAPLDQQKRIVQEIEKQFSHLDEAVADLKRVKANLKRYKAAVLKAAVEGRLVETEASIARCEKRTYETGEQLLRRILETRRSRALKAGTQTGRKGKGKYKEPAGPDTTDLPELPEGWAWASLDQLSWGSSYGTSAKCAYDNKGSPVLRIPNVEKAAIDLADVKYGPSDLPITQSEALSPGDMLIIRTNGSKSLIGRAAIVTTHFQKLTTYASYLIRFRLLADSHLPDWVLTFWPSPSSRLWIQSKAATSAGQHNISMSVLATTPLPLPPANEQTRIVAEVDHRLSLIHATEAQVDVNIKRAERLRQSVLHTAFSFGPDESQ